MTMNTDDQEKQRRRQYQHAYYRANRERFQAYQREYSRTHKKSSLIRGQRSSACGPAITKGKNFTASDLMHMPTEKSIRIIDAILRGRASLII